MILAESGTGDMANMGQLAVDEYGNPFIIMEEQQTKKRLKEYYRKVPEGCYTKGGFCVVTPDNVKRMMNVLIKQDVSFHSQEYGSGSGRLSFCLAAATQLAALCRKPQIWEGLALRISRAGAGQSDIEGRAPCRGEGGSQLCCVHACSTDNQ